MVQISNKSGYKIHTFLQVGFSGPLQLATRAVCSTPEHYLHGYSGLVQHSGSEPLNTDVSTDPELASW